MLKIFFKHDRITFLFKVHLEKMGCEKNPKKLDDIITPEKHKKALFKYKQFYGLKPTGKFLSDSPTVTYLKENQLI